MNTLMGVCADALRKHNLSVEVVDEEELSVTLPDGEEITLSLDFDWDVDEIDEGTGQDLCSFKPVQIEDDWWCKADVLYSCLAALAQSEVGKNITDVSVDGGTSDCEALFCWDGDYVALKVR